MLLDPRFYLALLLAALIGIAGGFSTGHKAASKQAKLDIAAIQLKAATDLAAANEANRLASKKAADDLATLDAKHHKEQVNAAAKTKALLERVRAGAVGLYLPAHCPGHTGTGTDTALAGGAGAEERAELSGTAAEFLIALTSEADATAIQLNAVIDAYQTARRACSTGKTVP